MRSESGNMRWDVMRKFPGFWSQTLATITPGFLLFPIIIIFSSGVLCQKLSRWYIWPRSSIMQSHRIVNYKMNDSSVTSWTTLISQEITFHWNIQDCYPLPPETGYTFKPIVINLANMQVMFDNEEFRSIPIWGLNAHYVIKRRQSKKPLFPSPSIV